MSAAGSRAPRATKIGAPPSPQPNVEPSPASTDARPHADNLQVVADIGRELAAIFQLLGRAAQAGPLGSPAQLGSLAQRDAAAERRQGRESATAGLETTAALLRELQLGLLRYPVAAQAAFKALVAEGRAFASTPAGGQLEQQLLASSGFRQLRRIYESLTWHMLEDQGDRRLPSAYFDALAQVLDLDHIEPFLAALHSVKPKR